MQRVIETIQTNQILRLDGAEYLGASGMRQIDLFDTHLLGVVDHHHDLVDVDGQVTLEQLDGRSGQAEQLEDVLQEHQTEISHLGIIVLYHII